MRTFLTFSLLATILLGVVAGTSRATAPGENGRIAFRRYFNNDHSWGAVFTIRPDGTGQQQVTHPPMGTVDDQPDWAPDGSLITFSRCPRETGGPCAVYTVRPDGRALTLVSKCPPGGAPPKCSDDNLPTFSPDGGAIAFSANTGHQSIVVVNRATRVRRVLQRGTQNFSLGDPQFSPDGSRIVFERVQGNDGPRALYAADLNGSHVRRLTPWSLDAGDNPDWSPDGMWILFRSHERHDGKQSQIYVIHPDGRGLRQLTHFPKGAIVASSSFSPAGDWIVLATDGVGGNADLYAMHADGMDMHPITRTKLWESAPDWGSSP